MVQSTLLMIGDAALFFFCHTLDLVHWALGTVITRIMIFLIAIMMTLNRTTLQCPSVVGRLADILQHRLVPIVVGETKVERSQLSIMIAPLCSTAAPCKHMSQKPRNPSIRNRVEKVLEPFQTVIMVRVWQQMIAPCNTASRRIRATKDL